MCILYTSLQKFYNSLKALELLNISNDLIENISNIDNFFSEFRNITFVMQKSFSNNNCLDIYNRNQYLILTDEMRWFVDKRNETIKEFPIKLEKEINFYKYILFIKTLMYQAVIDINSEDTLHELIKLKLNEIASEQKLESHITVELIFKENNEPVDMYERIFNGINIMNNFITKIDDEIKCECKLCTKLKDEINKLLNSIKYKKILFSFDYHIPANNKSKIEPAQRMEVYLGDNKKMVSPREMRMPISIYQDYHSNTHQLFNFFTISHCNMYNGQNNRLMSTFFILFQDNTFIMYPFSPGAKATTYKEVNYVADIIKSDTVKCVFFIAEVYMSKYSKDTVNMDSEERIKHANSEGLISTMISDQLYEIQYCFDSKHMDNNNIQLIISKAERTDFQSQSMFLPIYISFIKKSKMPFSNKGLVAKYPFILL